MQNPPTGHRAIDDSDETPPPSVPMNTLPSIRPRAIDTPMNNPRPILHRIICIHIHTEPIPPVAAAAVDRFFKRMMKKSDAFTLGLFFASFGLLYFFLKNPYSGDHFAIALGLRLIVLIITGFLYSYSCFTDPGPEFLKVQVTVLVFCVGLLLLAMFLTRHT